MKKLLAITCILVLCLTFTLTAFTPPAAASGPCIQTCLNGTLIVCCPTGNGWDCYWDGPCDWGPIF